MTAVVRNVLTLLPGEVCLGTRGDWLETLLGSCVAIVLTDPRRTVGAMCHIVHTRDALDAEHATGASAAVALRSMTALLEARGITPRLCEAYVYGGGNMFPQLPSVPHIGDDNAAWALAALESLGVDVIDCDLGGEVYRRLSWQVGPDAPAVVAMPVESRPVSAPGRSQALIPQCAARRAVP